MHEAWHTFLEHLDQRTPPPLDKGDIRQRDDPEWMSAAAAYLELRTAYDELSTKFDEAKAKIVGMANHAKEEGGGISVTHIWKRGSVDYKKIPQLKGLDLDQYRAPSREETRITTM